MDFSGDSVGDTDGDSIKYFHEIHVDCNERSSTCPVLSVAVA